jgi:hypothetical protein
MNLIHKISIILLIFIDIMSSLSISRLENGCTAYECKRNCFNSNRISKTPGDNGFKFEIAGLKDNKYVADKIYQG